MSEIDTDRGVHSGFVLPQQRSANLVDDAIVNSSEVEEYGRIAGRGGGTETLVGIM